MLRFLQRETGETRRTGGAGIAGRPGPRLRMLVTPNRGRSWTPRERPPHPPACRPFFMARPRCFGTRGEQRAYAPSPAATTCPLTPGSCCSSRAQRPKSVETLERAFEQSKQCFLYNSPHVLAAVREYGCRRFCCRSVRGDCDFDGYGQSLPLAAGIGRFRSLIARWGVKFSFTIIAGAPRTSEKRGSTQIVVGRAAASASLLITGEGGLLFLASIANLALAI